MICGPEHIGSTSARALIRDRVQSMRALTCASLMVRMYVFYAALARVCSLGNHVSQRVQRKCSLWYSRLKRLATRVKAKVRHLSFGTAGSIRGTHGSGARLLLSSQHWLIKEMNAHGIFPSVRTVP